MNLAPGNFVYEYLKNGATISMAVDGSTAKQYKYTVPAGKTFYLSRMNFALVDGTMQYGKFGALTALSNGIKIQALDTDGTTELCDFTAGQQIKTNEDFSCLAGVDAIAEPGAGDDFLPIRFTVNKAGAFMELTAGQIIQITIQDNISDLTVFKCMIQGIISPCGNGP